MSTTDTSNRVTAALIVIADEVLSGRTRDQNIGNVATHLTAIGIELNEVRVVADRHPAIIAAVDELWRRVTYVITTGGLGPTHDDITAQAIADVFRVALAVDERAVALMQPYYDARGLELTPSRLRMARIPAGAELIANPVSAAPGFMIENVIVLPGIPETARLMLLDVSTRLATGLAVRSASLDVPCPESELADLFALHQQEHPEVSMGSYPQVRDGIFVTQLVLRATDQRSLEVALTLLRAKLAACGRL